MRVGYLGPRGTFSEEAALHLGAEEKVTPVPLSSLAEVVRGIKRGHLGRGVLPVESSGEGAVGQTLDLVAAHSAALEICAELVLPIRHHLLVSERAVAATVRTISSHPQALAQCRRRIAARYPEARLRETASTAEAARMVAASAPGMAALGSRRAASIYGLRVLDSHVTDLERNVTRFWVLGPPGCRRGRAEKTSLLAAVKDRPGALYELLGVFARRGLNLTRIESRPARTRLGEYIFFIDFQGAMGAPAMESLPAELAASCRLIRVLGSYPVDGNGI